MIQLKPLKNSPIVCTGGKIGFSIQWELMVLETSLSTLFSFFFSLLLLFCFCF